MARINKSLTKQSRDVSFSKRKKGLLNKAMEICILSNAQVALIIASPTGKLTVFGHSSSDEIFNHFLRKTIPCSGLITDEHNIQIQVQELTRLNSRLEVIKKREKDHMNGMDLQQWIESRWNNAQTEEEFIKVVKDFESLKEKLTARIHRMQPDV